MLQAFQLGKQFGAFTAVSDVTLEVEPGQILALLGPNGAGKTATVRMLASLLRPSTGRATVAGYDTVTEAPQVRRRVGMLTELPALYARMSALDYLEFYGKLYDMPPAQSSAQAEHLLRYFGIWDDRRRAIGAYSKGMRQKVALARALLHGPQVILLDEPTSAMDPASAKTVRDYILGLREQGRTILICTHNLAEAEALADRIAIIQLGRISVKGTIAELKLSLLGSPLHEIRFSSPVDRVHFSVDGLATIEEYGATWVRYRTSKPEDANPVFVRHLINAGAEIVSVSQMPQSLEAVYLRMVGEE